MSDLFNKVNYSTVRYTIGWLPGAIGFTETAKATLAHELGVQKDRIRGQYAILGAGKDPLIKEGAALKQILSEIRKQYTIPECALIQADTVLSSESTGNKKIKGSYLIENARVDEFMEKFHEARMAYLTWGQKLKEPENYERIRAADAAALGKDWSIVASKYPSAEELADRIQCELPSIQPYDVEFQVEDIAPTTVSRLRETAIERLQASVNGAVFEFTLELKNMINKVSQSCGKRVRVLPLSDSKFAEYRNAEVQAIMRHEDDPEIKPDHLLITLQPYAANEKGKLNQKGPTVELVVTKSEYTDELRPLETEENKVLTEASFSNLVELVNRFKTIGNMLGENPELHKVVAEVENTLTNFGSSAEKITAEIRGTEFTRRTARNQFEELGQKLLEVETVIKKKQTIPKRRIKL